MLVKSMVSGLKQAFWLVVHSKFKTMLKSVTFWIPVL